MAEGQAVEPRGDSRGGPLIPEPAEPLAKGFSLLQLEHTANVVYKLQRSKNVLLNGDAGHPVLGISLDYVRWIPACAGMTNAGMANAAMTNAGMAAPCARIAKPRITRA